MNPQKNRKRKNHKVRGVRINKTVALLVLFCLCIGGISLVSAKYIKQRDINKNSVSAEEFYFESDLLDGGTHEVVPTENNGSTASVTIRLKNYVDELRFSETRILYNVSITEDGNTDAQASGVAVTYPENSKDQESGLYVIESGKTQNADVTLSGLVAGKTYIVTATTGNTYQKTLKGTIKVKAPDTAVYASISGNTDQYIEVTVWTTDYSGTVKLIYGDMGLIPDNTDILMTGQLSTGGTIENNNWVANTSHVFRFFKSTDATGKQYQVTVNGMEVIVSEAQ